MYAEIQKSAETIRINEFISAVKERNFGIIDITDNGIRKIGVLGKEHHRLSDLWDKFEDVVKEVHFIEKPYKFTSRDFKQSDTVIKIKDVEIGGKNFALFAGPCSVENREMVMEIAAEVKKNGGKILRGGAFKPRTSPYDFQGLEEEGLIYMREACDKYRLLMCTEIMDSRNIDLVCRYADILQVGARNMQNFSLLKDLGKISKPVLLKRGMAAGISEFLMAAEYLIAYGNSEIILCERGIKTFEKMTRNTVDINAVALIKELSHLPIVIDASHGTGIRTLVEPVTMAGIMAGADGAMIEVHKNPCCAVSDGDQTLDFEMFESTAEKIFKTAEFRKSLK